jgi:NADPH:quinone reductase-like Zn-dependent oxidoreductase
MKAIAYHNFGSPDVLQCEDIEKPVPKSNEVLIKVRAASVNPLDHGELKGVPFIVRIMLGLRKPEATRPGVDVAGVVEAVGRNVTQFKPGDEVFGVCISNPHNSGVKVWVHDQGAFAEYACAPESTLVLKPENVTFEQAAAVPIAALTALQGLRDKVHSAGAESLDSRCRGRRGYVRCADRQVVRRRCHRRVQDEQCGVGPIHRRKSGD